ncbi:MAG: gluconokinase [Chloroflexota bacterium]
MVIIIMGVSGCGKTTVGRALAQQLGVPFFDADDYHPAANVAKMGRGEPLTDADREPWLARLHGMIGEWVGEEMEEITAVFACSALKKTYRDQLRGSLDGVVFVYLAGDFDLIWLRLAARQGHFMKANMLQSQFDTLEPPTAVEALTIPITLSPAEIINQILHQAFA